jgi:hypothetical protein
MQTQVHKCKKLAGSPPRIGLLGQCIDLSDSLSTQVECGGEAVGKSAPIGVLRWDRLLKNAGLIFFDFRRDTFDTH